MSESKLALPGIFRALLPAAQPHRRTEGAGSRSAEGASLIENWYAAPRSGERFILTGRVLLALLSLLSVTLDGGPRPVLLSIIAISYCVYAFTLIVMSRRRTYTFGERVATHIADLACFSVFAFLIRGSVSPTFAFFFFSLLCAAILFRVKGTILTALAVVAIYVAVGAATTEGGTDLALKELAIRTGHITVVAGLAIYLAAYLSRLHSELSGLAAWPRIFSRNSGELIQEMLRRSSDLLSFPRVVMIWSEEEEPWIYVASTGRQNADIERHQPGVYEPMVDESLTDRSFFCPDTDSAKPRILYERPSESQTDWAVVVHPDLRDAFDMKSVLSVPLPGETFQGRLFFLDRQDAGAYDIRLGEILARLIAARLDHFHLARQAERSAIAEERVRLARDLHDGLLQSLTAASLQLEAARRLVSKDPLRANELLTELHDDVTRDHEELRVFIRDLRPGAIENEPDFGLHNRLADLSALVQRQWGVGVEVRLDSLDSSLNRTWRKEVYRLIREAVVNAAKHANADHVIVETRFVNGKAEITVADDGNGFPFYGTFTLRELTEMERGPRTLKERITSLNGELKLTSTESGALLRMTLPIRALQS